eukprot:988958-Amphidinium_carterae.1
MQKKRLSHNATYHPLAAKATRRNLSLKPVDHTIRKETYVDHTKGKEKADKHTWDGFEGST